MNTEAKFLTFCIGCGVLEELKPTPELMETVDINQVVDTEPCPPPLFSPPPKDYNLHKRKPNASALG